MGGPGSGRLPRELPDGIGVYCDEAVAAMNDMNPEAVRALRRRRDIPPASEPHRSRWFSERDCEEWTPPIEHIPG